MMTHVPVFPMFKVNREWRRLAGDFLVKCEAAVGGGLASNPTEIKQP
jgi:hypothetical protein